MSSNLVTSVLEMSALSQSWKGHTIAFVPTMGALHQGHLTLVQFAKNLGQKVVMSIFVNPIQFGVGEDFESYPRTLKADMELLAPLSVDAVFAPNAAQMYPEFFQTYVSQRGAMSSHLCGASRPGHFDGVCTVVLKLFNIVKPTHAVFGKKDYQQLAIIKKMVRDLNISTEIIGHDIVRESDGLAMSSRNRYMSAEEREEATLISKGLNQVKQAFVQGERITSNLKQIFRDTIQQGVHLSIEYAEVCNASTLVPVGESVDQGCVFLVALRLPSVRLIDNVELS